MKITLNPPTPPTRTILKQSDRIKIDFISEHIWNYKFKQDQIMFKSRRRKNCLFGFIYLYKICVLKIKSILKRF